MYDLEISSTEPHTAKAHLPGPPGGHCTAQDRRAAPVRRSGWFGPFRATVRRQSAGSLLGFLFQNDLPVDMDHLELVAEECEEGIDGRLRLFVSLHEIVIENQHPSLF
jgi:hypothetical protein